MFIKTIYDVRINGCNIYHVLIVIAQRLVSWPQFIFERIRMKKEWVLRGFMTWSIVEKRTTSLFCFGLNEFYIFSYQKKIYDQDSLFFRYESSGEILRLFLLISIIRGNLSITTMDGLGQILNKMLIANDLYLLICLYKCWQWAIILWSDKIP